MSGFLFSSAFAQEQAQTAAQAGPSGFMSFLPLILIALIFYFLIIRPQKKKLNEEVKFVNALQKGTEVYTKSGMIGTIVGITDHITTLEVSDGVKIKIIKSQIGGLASDLFAKKTEEKK